MIINQWTTSPAFQQMAADPADRGPPFDSAARSGPYAGACLPGYLVTGLGPANSVNAPGCRRTELYER